MAARCRCRDEGGASLEVDTYVAAGIKVIRLHARNKKPIISSWTRGEDPELVRRHVEQGGNFGRLVSEQHFVLDVDRRNGLRFPSARP